MPNVLCDWQSLVDNLPDLVVCLDPQLRHVFVNRAWTKETGISLDACQGKTSREIGLPENLCEILEFAAQRVLAEKQPHQFDHPFFGPRGEQHFSSSVTPELDAAGEVVRLIALIRNITGRVKAEAACAEQEIRLHAFLDHGPHIAWIKDEAGRHVYVSGSFERQLHVRAEDWLGKTDHELWPADIADRFRANDQDVLRDGQTRQVFEETRDADGEIRYWWNFKFLMRDAAGRNFVGGSGVDITEQKRASLAAARLAAIVEASHDVILSKDLNGVVQTWNHSAERVFGYSAQEMIGQSIMVLIPAELQQEEREILYRVRQGEQVGHYETLRQRKDGQRIPVALTISPIRDERGQIVAASNFIRELNAPQRLRLLRDPPPS